MTFMRLLCFCVLFIIGNPAYAKSGMPISKIFDQFVVSSAAASRCIKPEEKVLTDFFANLQMVTVYTQQYIAKKYPDFTKDKIANIIKNRSDSITQNVFSLVSEKGCEDPSIKQAVDRFYVQAKWQPRKK